MANQNHLPPQQHQLPSQPVNGVQGIVNNAIDNQRRLGHTQDQPDFNYIFGIVQEFSDVLAQNRADTAHIISSVQQLQAQAHETGQEPPIEQVNGELTEAMGSAEAAGLKHRLHEVSHQRDRLQTENNETLRLLEEYQQTMNSLMDRIRQYANEHANAVIGVHKHYESQLAQEREANLALRIEHGQWQAGLGRVTDYARQALRARTDETSGLERGLREVKAENRVLRRIVGWHVDESSDDEDMGSPTSRTGSKAGDSTHSK